MKEIDGREIVQEGDRFFRVKDGKREELFDCTPFGFLTSDEWTKLRQTEPRYAP